MKKLCFLFAFVLVLTGCQAAPTFETTDDVYGPQPQSAPRQVALELPEGVQTIAGEQGKLYLCEDYTVAVQTLEAGDLDKTLRTVTGYGREELTLLQLRQGEFDRYECAWASAGEEQQVGRTLILDDGCYHYTVTVLAPATLAGKLTEDWQALMASVRIGQLSTGS
jgi:hypothetical protein